MGGISALHGILLRFAAALVCVAACEGLLRPAALSAWTDVQARANGANQLKAAEEIPARQRGVRVVQHGGYPELQVDGKPFFITSAEFCYPRVPRKLWEVSLDRYRELGINTITLSIPWNWH
ncbi:MAG TPA: beta-galactosidase, partial [Candidatus Acidoferrales bacterium]|nr:beta-galactosidase [Candidatus Acidoferrales bacterium]